ncbi:CPBP family intramembrane glutamic endopeptidase [Devriesea agamarum]|uniref:CPBP family intramembrane glutamic endopeptidase n=1 Tax=Devriesea agamarum TaxID=472569 RepID=UPI00071DF857|nr:CPBP family intramembrane glutamic endopeptidase [Devriesea agamarum]
MALQIVAAIAVMAFVAKRVARRPMYELERSGALREFGYGTLVGVSVITVAIACLLALGSYRITDIIVGRGLLSGLLLGLGSAFGEEIVMRGILLRVLIGMIGAAPALILTSVAFGLLHLGNPGASLLSAIGIALQAGVMFGAAYLLTRRLWFAIGIHSAWNFTQTAIFGLNVSGVPTEPGLFIAEIHGPDWLTGGGLGIEGSIIMIALGLIVSTMLLLRASAKNQARPLP